MHHIITISREYGSGGHQIGVQLAARLGIKFYDKEILKEAALRNRISEEAFEKVDEKPTSSFLYSLFMETESHKKQNGAFDKVSNSHEIFFALTETIRELAKQESMVVVGRCADFILKEYKNAYHIFVKSDLNSRIERISKLNHLTENEALLNIIKTDKQRAAYYNYFTNQKWSDLNNYDITINVSKLGVLNTTDILEQVIEKWKSN